MATGSGKTIIMAGLMLYLYEQGYRNFLFFVNSTNIIRKTEDNFLNTASSKYLFNKTIVFGNKQVSVRQVDNFEDANSKDLNVCFTTIQKLHGDLINEKENSITFEDFKNKKIVLLSDEAHHGQVQTRNGELFDKPNWENTVEKIFRKNAGNILLEFTATIDLNARESKDKYLNKIIYKYDLKQFRNDGFSKDPELLPSDTDKKDRIIQAIILSQYRQEVAAKHGINLKPVILFKAQRTVLQSEDNKTLFHKIIDELSAKDISAIRSRTNLEVIQRAFGFFKERKITDAILIRKLKDSFAESKCLSVNNEPEKEVNQLLVNSLEDSNNQIRAIFAVQKLNEGWDVLNLFDIVRLYETRQSGHNVLSPTTISEAQLIGRGARYFPFKISDDQDKFKRKFDKDTSNELRILEQLHYHSNDEHRYISEIREALINEGLIDDNEIEVDFKLKESFKKKKFYSSGIVWKNERIKTPFEKMNLIKDLPISRRNIEYAISSGFGTEEAIFNGNGHGQKQEQPKLDSKSVKMEDIPAHIILNALARIDFFDFDKITHYFPKISSIEEFIKGANYLANLSINFRGKASDLINITNGQLYFGALALFNELEIQIKSNVTEYKGTEEFKPNKFKDVFVDKKIKIKKVDQGVDSQFQYLESEDWYPFEIHHGTAQERDFLMLMEREKDTLYSRFANFYFVRNEKHLKIYNFKDGRAFEPDYLLFGIDHRGNHTNYQIFMEAKGPHLVEHDKWKQDFLQEITKKFGKLILKINGKQYQILGLPFYVNEDENQFAEKLEEIIA
jgi:type III restriction enzyme